MAVDRTLWTTYASETFRKSYPCPRCGKGQVKRGENPIVRCEPHFSKRSHNSEEWEPDWVTESFTTMLVCNNTICGEIVAVSGRAGVDYHELYNEDGEPDDIGYSTWLKPVSMYPAPPLFPIPKSLPSKVQEELKLAFQLFWTDRSASTSRLRTSLERVLDNKGIPTSTPDANGFPKRLSLFARIDLFEKATNDSDSSESMNALRVVGNIGTHGDEVADGDYFDLLDVYEDALLDIYEHKKAGLKAKKQSLIALGKP